MTNYDFYHNTTLPAEYLDMPMRDFIECAFDEIKPSADVETFIKWSELAEVWLVCLWDSSTDTGVMYSYEVGSDDDYMDFKLVSAHRPGYYKKVRIDFPQY